MSEVGCGALLAKGSPDSSLSYGISRMSIAKVINLSNDQLVDIIDK